MQECKKQIVEQESQRERLIASMDEQESLHQTQIHQLNAKLEEAENNCVDATMQLLTSTVQLQETEEFNTVLVQKNTAMKDTLMSLEKEKSQLESEKQVLMEQEEEMQRNLKSVNAL